MILIFVYIILLVYSAAILLIFVYSLAQLNLLFNYLKSKKANRSIEKFNFSMAHEIPYVTVQLPIFNEKYVLERLIKNIVLLKYPVDKLEIQVLDDSTDGSRYSTSELVTNYALQGYNISHVFRENRSGFKAGALKEGLEVATGEYIAIFDADFLPKEDWLLRTVPSFKDANIGVVQTRWSHLNRNYSILTKVQAFALDAHFTLEQTGRNAKEHCINFNGTAGIWRKSCILDAGNWEGDTLTEDLDLSYRAQLKNWKFIYLEDVETPAELPMILSAARSQQFRWNKGGAENFVKNADKILVANTISIKTKIHGLLHLLNSSMFLCLFIMAVFSVPMLYVKYYVTEFRWYFDMMFFFIITSVIFFICYWFSYKSIHGSSVKSFMNYIGLFFTFYTVAMGFSLQNSIAVLEGFIGKKSEFVRTPKFNLDEVKDTWKKNIYISKGISKYTIGEGFLAVYFLFGLFSGYQFGDFDMYPLHLMLILGYGYVFVQSFKSK
jgi:cellulose synthase/poly-beta-1,6-N-acetylglucosamine synthase-like glycosyltransferase